MVALGLLYAAGRGVPQDWAAAVYWWRKAEPTHPFASRLLGDAYVCGLGLSPSHERALHAYRSSVERGDVILVSMAAFGQTGPDAARPGYGPVMEELSGIAFDDYLKPLEAILRDVAEELAGWRSRAQKAEAELKARGGPVKNANPDLESENKALRQRVEGARTRVHDLMQRLTFLEEQARDNGGATHK